MHPCIAESGKSKALFSRSTTICLAIWAIPSVVLAVDPNFGLQGGGSHDETSAKSPARASASQADARDGAKKVDSAKNDGGAKKGGFAKNEDGANPRQTVSIVTWNAEDRGNAGDIGTLARRRDPDVIALPEYGDYREGSRTRLQNMLAKAGKNPEDCSIFESLLTGEIAPTTLVVHKRLGEYRKVDAVKTTFGSVMLRPVGDRTSPAGDRRRRLQCNLAAHRPRHGLDGRAGGLRIPIRHVAKLCFQLDCLSDRPHIRKRPGEGVRRRGHQTQALRPQSPRRAGRAGIVVGTSTISRRFRGPESARLKLCV